MKQVNARIPDDLAKKVKELGKEKGWGGQREVIEQALKLFAKVVERDAIAVRGRQALDLKGVEKALRSGEKFKVTPLPGTFFSPKVLEELGEIIVKYLEQNPPQTIRATKKSLFESSGEELDSRDEHSKEIKREKIPERAREGKDVSAIWGLSKRELVPGVKVDSHEKVLELNPTIFTVRE